MIAISAACAVCLAGPEQEADHVGSVGYAKLEADLGPALPTGAGIPVAHVESPSDPDEGPPGWTPDPSLPEFADKVFIFPCQPSRHGTDVGSLFYGRRSMTPGIRLIACLPSPTWGYDPGGCLRTGRPLLPLPSAALVTNHSWFAKAEQGLNLEVLKRIDFLVAVDDAIQVAGASNHPEVPDVLQCSLNAIIVGRSSGRHSIGTNKLDDDVYVSGRAKPDLVAPARFTSTGAPMVASAAALLLAVGQERGAELSNGSYVSPRTGRTVHRCMTSEVIKAVLMAGADRTTAHNPEGLGDLTNYRSSRRDCTDNGLDRRYGAGQLNIDTSYHILVSGECDSEQDRASAAEAGGRTASGGSVPLQGFDYDPAFGGAEGSNRVASYRFVAPAGDPWFRCCLAWNVEVNAQSTVWDGLAVLRDMDLKLFDHTESSRRPAAESQSWIDSTENIACAIRPGHEYELRVLLPLKQGEFLWDYGLAWLVSQGNGALPVARPQRFSHPTLVPGTALPRDDGLRRAGTDGDRVIGRGSRGAGPEKAAAWAQRRLSG